MRVAIYHNLMSGGAKRTVREVAARLSASHDIRVYTLSCANHDFADLRPHATQYQVFDFRPAQLLRSPFGRLNQIIRLYDLLRLGPLNRRVAAHIEQDGADVVFVHPCQFENSPSVLRHLRRVPAVYYCHETLRRLYEPMPPRPYERRSAKRRLVDRLDPLPGLYHAVLKRTDRRNLRAAPRVLVNSEFTRQQVKEHYGAQAEVSYWGVDAERFRPLGLEKQSVFLSVGSLTPLKGFDFLIRAIAHLPAALRRPLVVASNFQNPPERDYLQDLARQLDVELRLPGTVSDDDLVRLYNEAQLTVYAPVREPFGLVALESLACGTPVVAVREGGVQESVVHEQVGLLAEREPRAFAAALSGLLEQPGRTEALGRQGRELVLRRWTWAEAVRRIERHLTAATATPRPQPALA
jgi:glycosyltransferase involved in cell wall biosynthesis